MGSESIREYRPLRECTSTGSVSYGIVQPGSHVENGVPIIRVNNINDGSLDITSPLKVDPQIDEKHRKTRLEGGEVLLSLVGTTGQCVVAGPELKDWNVARAIAVIKPAQGISAEWISICLKSPAAQHYLDSRANTTVQKTLNLQDVREIPIMTVSEAEERYILEWWTTLNDKIELNRRMNATLEGMAQALFKSWFVDFDPVIDNALAAGNPIPEELAARARLRQGYAGQAEVRRHVSAEASAKGEAAETFPSAFQETEPVGWIPEGWEVKPLESIIKLIGGGTPKTSIEEYWKGEIPWFSVVDAPNDSDVFVIDTEKKITSAAVANSSTKVLRPGTTIISARGTVGKCALVGREMAMNQSCYGIQGADDIGDIFTYYIIRKYVADLQQRGHGSVFNTITRDTFRAIAVPFCGKELTHHFDKVVSPQLNRIRSNLAQLETLTNLRDTLLPKLISGELRIPEAEQLTEEALA